MELLMMVPIILITNIISICGEPTNNFNRNVAKSKSFFGDILKPPPPPPPLHGIAPVPFHGGSGHRIQRQNIDIGYQYPPPPPPPPIPPSSNFRLPSPFHKPFSFNFVPPPQPFYTTPSPSVFQKLQSWLYPPSQPAQITGPSAVTNIAPINKDCNPCNLVPWIPVIRYNEPENFNFREPVSPTYGSPAPTYGPPSVTATPMLKSPHPFYGLPRQQSSTSSPLSPNYGPPSTTYGQPFSSRGAPIQNYGPPSFSTPSSTYGPPQPTDVETLQPQVNQPPSGISNQLPKVSYPTGFKNSYGEPVTISIPYNEYQQYQPFSATAAESSKIKAEVVPADHVPENINNVTLSKPTPFSRQHGRGIIHTLQPVALPNLSVSPLPPIFNARPFRTNIQGTYNSHSESIHKEVKIVPSIPLAEFSHSIEYPVHYVQSPIVDIDGSKINNRTKGYRVIPYPDISPESHQNDASSQASEAHTASANNDASFESTGTGTGNELYGSFSTIHNKDNEGFLRLDPSQRAVPSNHRPDFADLRGMAEATDENGLRSEQHLQAIDSPILYLRPGAPHKEFNTLFGISSTSVPETQEFELYDDITTTISPPVSTASDVWSTNKYSEYQEESQTLDKNKNNPKIVQIIIPYTHENEPISDDDQGTRNVNEWVQANYAYGNQGRKVPAHTESYTSSNSYSDIQYTTPTPLTLQPTESATEYYEPPRLTAASILNDLYDVKEPPFDIVELQNNIDGWTEQEFSKHYKLPHKLNYKGKYAKKIPDEYFTTLYPATNFYTASMKDYKGSFFDHEGANSMQHTIKDDIEENATQRSAKEYNLIDRHNEKKNHYKGYTNLKPHIYTAASSFRSLSTTTPPWGQIQTSISPLTKEKVYVVTAQPWREDANKTDWFDGSSFESKKTTGPDSEMSASDNLPFKSPRFSNRPSFPTGSGSAESVKTESSYSLGKSWHQSINALETSAEQQRSNSTSSPEGDRATPRTNADETTTYTTAETIEDTTQS